MFNTITNILQTDNPFFIYKLYVIICYLLRNGLDTLEIVVNKSFPEKSILRWILFSGNCHSNMSIRVVCPLTPASTSASMRRPIRPIKRRSASR